nr:hypothetical protein [Tanacetum cinerariifolium]
MRNRLQLGKFKLIVISRQLILFFKDYHLMCIHSLIITELPKIYWKGSTINARYLIVQGRRSSFAAGTFGTRTNISATGGNNSGQQRVVKCFNCQGEGHMARQCPKPKQKTDATWFRDKVLLVEVQGSGKVLNEEELEFLIDPRVVLGQVTLTVITHNASYQADDLGAYDSECDDFSTAKAVLMANLSSY